MKRWLPALLGLVFIGFQVDALAKRPGPDPSVGDVVALGRALFFDENLSANGTQSCAACHEPGVGFTGPDAAVNAGGAVYQGAIPHRYGGRKPPSAAYAGDSPVLRFEEARGGWVGGMFWDGRATGAVLGDTLAEQAQGPFLNPLEQALANEQVLCVRVKQSEYAGLFRKVWGPDALDCAKDEAGVYEKIGRSVAAYERSAEVSAFSSKFDLFWDDAVAAGKNVTKIKLTPGGPGAGATAVATIVGGVVKSVKVVAGGSGYEGAEVSFKGMMGSGATAVAVVSNGAITAINVTNGGSNYRNAPVVVIKPSDPNYWTEFRGFGLSDAELQGLAGFNDPNGANCASCHSIDPGSSGRPLFTDFGYDNLGVPKNPENPFYGMPAAWNPEGAEWLDEGLGGYLKSAGYAAENYEPEIGKHKVPTLRNVDRRPDPGFVKAYGHNGYFKSLEDVLRFYHWRGMCGGMGGGGMGGGMGGGGMGGGGMTCGQMSGMFPPPEVAENLAPSKAFPSSYLDYLLAFLKTLSDGYGQ